MDNYDIGKKRKSNFIIVVCICAAGIIASVIIAFSFLGDINIYNKGISDAGNKNTKIVFSKNEFYPANKLQSYVLNMDYNYLNDGDKKYARYFDSKGNEKQIIIKCKENIKNYIVFECKGKNYVYISKELGLKAVNYDNISDVYITGDSLFAVKTNMWNVDFSLNYNDINVLKKYLKSDKKAASEKTTEQYLGSNARTLHITFYSAGNNTDYSGVNSPIGEFFKDNENNIYYYDYIDEKAYYAGKEMSKIVYQEN